MIMISAKKYIYIYVYRFDQTGGQCRFSILDIKTASRSNMRNWLR